MAKYLLIAAIVISLSTAVLGYMNHDKLVTTLGTLDQTKTTLVSKTRELTTTQASLKTMTATLDATNADKEKLATDLTSSKADLTKAQGDLDAANKASTDKDAKIADDEAQLEKLKALAGGTDQNGKANDLGAQITSLNQQIQELTASLSSANEQVKSDNTMIADFKEKESERQKNLMKQGLEGRVLAVNPAWNFVVLSIGDKQGVVNNAELLLKRSGQYLGKVRITSVEPSTSIADIVANSLPSGVAVQPGDSVIFQSTSAAPTTTQE